MAGKDRIGAPDPDTQRGAMCGGAVGEAMLFRIEKIADNTFVFIVLMGGFEQFIMHVKLPVYLMHREQVLLLPKRMGERVHEYGHYRLKYKQRIGNDHHPGEMAHKE
jgi:hypothetical protein